MKDFCIILMFDKKFLKKSWSTIQQIRKVGLYEGNIVCILANNLHDKQDQIYKDENTILMSFHQYDTTPILKDVKKVPQDYEKQEVVRVCFPMKQKMIHYHKFYCFHTYFKDNYKKCFYIDTNTQIFKPLDKIINLDCSGKLLVHSNAYPKYEEGDKLYTQFDQIVYPDLYKELNQKYDLNIDHFQATVMLFDTAIIENNTFEELNKLAFKYVNSKTNDQAILNLYFNCIKKCWQQLPIKDDETHFYDFYERGDLKKTDYIMVKYPKT